MPDVYLCEIIENNLLTEAIYSITVVSRELAAASAAGQFLHIKCGEARILRRPISICYVSGDKINFVFDAIGAGTKWLSKRRPGQILDILGPLGRGFLMPEGNVITVGGGVGTPPMLFAAKSAKAKVTAVLGFRNTGRVILTEEFKKVCDNVYITTDDGSVGIHGAVTLPLKELLESGDYTSVMSCGQLLMQKAVADMCRQYGVNCQVSLEERMGCGVGACLVCACAIRSGNDESIQMSRACIDGPVFDAKEVFW